MGEFDLIARHYVREACQIIIGTLMIAAVIITLPLLLIGSFFIWIYNGMAW